MYSVWSIRMISVIIPTLNEEQSIGRVLRALRSQSYKGPVELIVADSMSEDKTVKIAKKYADKVIIIEKRRVGAGRNAGARVAEGDILTFLDADTIPAYNLLETVAKTFEDKNIIMATCPIISTQRGLVDYFVYCLVNLVSNVTAKLRRPQFTGIIIVCRKDVFEKAGGFTEELRQGEDLKFCLDIVKAKKGFEKFKYMGETFVYTSPRRIRKWGILRLICEWMYSIVSLYILRRGLVRYEVVR